MRNIRTEAIRFESNYAGEGSNATNYPTFRNITITDVVCAGAGRAARVSGSAHKPIENLTLENVSIKAGKGMAFDWVHGLKLIKVTSAPVAGSR